MKTAEADLKRKLLGQSLVFQALDTPTQVALAATGRLKSYQAGDLIFDVGSGGQSMMAIAQGSVRISILTPTARRVVLADLPTGEVFGEIALLDGGERSADAHALSNCTLVVLERRALMAVLNDQPEFALPLIELLCARLRRSDERMMDFAFLQLPTRIAKTLLRMSAGHDKTAKPQSRLSVSQSEIADMIGGTRENVNRCLRKWQATGLIDLKDGWLILLDRAGLQAVAEDI